MLTPHLGLLPVGSVGLQALLQGLQHSGALVAVCPEAQFILA